MQLIKDKPLFFHYRFKRTKLGHLIFNDIPCPGTDPNECGSIHNLGGATVAFNVATKTFGISRCHITDNFNKKIGRNVALGRSERGIPGNFGVMVKYDGPMTFDAVKTEADKLANVLFF